MNECCAVLEWVQCMEDARLVSGLSSSGWLCSAGWVSGWLLFVGASGTGTLFSRVPAAGSGVSMR